MPVVSAARLIDALRQHHLLGASQLNELAQARHADPRTLARELIEREWLTPYQVNQLMQDQAETLVLGQYVLLQRLNENALGQVYKARHQAMRRLVALTIVRESLLEQPEAVALFYEEIQAAGRLNHPHIVCAFDAGPIGNTHFFALEYVEGIHLENWVQRSGALPVNSATRFVRQVALGLQHAWARRLLHHDLKPANLLVTRMAAGGPGDASETPRPTSALFSEALVKVCNLGLTLLRPRPRTDVAAGAALTLPAVSADSLDYWPPEQAPGLPLTDIRSNLYSLGCIYYHLLTGRVPFPNGDHAAKLRLHQAAQPTPIEALRRDVPPEVAGIIRKLMAKRPEERFASPTDLLAALPSPAGPDLNSESWSTTFGGNSDATLTTPVPAPASDPTFVPTAVPVAPRRRWLPWLGVFVGLLTLVGLIAWAIAGPEKPRGDHSVRDAATPVSPAPPGGSAGQLTYEKKATREETILAAMRSNGFPTLEGKWHYVGPFDNTDRKGFAASYVSPKDVDLVRTYKGKGGKDIAWKDLPNFKPGEAYNLLLFPQNDWVAVYLLHEMDVATSVALPISLGSDDTLTVWLNGEKLVEENVDRAVGPDQARAILHLRPGKNQLLVKVCNGQGAFGFYAKAHWPKPLEEAFGASLRRDFPASVR